MRFVVNTIVYSLLITVLIFAVLTFFVKLPETEILSASKVFDVNGKLIDKLYIENRIKVSIAKIPEDLQNAIIAIEDNRFYKHFGIDPIGILRALYINIKEGKIVEGGSSMTQQLAKNLYLSHERTLSRKIKEVFLTLKLELLYTKKEILEMYLNQIYFGHGTYGVQSASQLYFGKNVSELNLAECTLLAGIPRRPEYYSPIKNFKAARERQLLILNKMVEYGYISREEAQKAKQTKIVLKKNITQTKAPYFVQYVLNTISRYDEELVKKIYTGGYKIYTTLDSFLQKAAEEAFKKNLTRGVTDSAGVVQPQGAIVAVDPSNGYIKAMIGGRDYSKSQFNRATARRQPGSAFKPFIYAVALDKGFTTIHQLMCEPIKYPKGDGTYWIPRDYNNDYHYRPISLREALVISDNVVSVQWLKKLGIKTVINFAKMTGIKSALNSDLTLALGSSEVTPLEMAAAYCVFANGGYRIEPIAVLKVVDPQGRIVISNTPTRKKVLDEKVAYILTDILKGVLRSGGTGAYLKVYGPAAGKTGTTQHNRDAWFVGYTPFISAAVYVGYDNPKQSLWSVGGVIAGPIWRDFINKTFEIYPQKDFEQPDGIITREICLETKKIANPTCPRTKEIFIPATEPKQKCPLLHWNDLLDEYKDTSEEQNKNDNGNSTHENNNDKLENENKSQEDLTENRSNHLDFILIKGLQEIVNSKEKAGN